VTDKQATVQSEIEELLRLMNRLKVTICGFAFSVDPPMIINFGNCPDAHTLKLYETLVKTCDERRNSGSSISSIVEEIH
jgi:hypothetical protein